MPKYLATYINQRNSRRGAYTVHIQSEIQKYKRKNRGKPPLIVFSFNSTQCMIIKDREEYLSGGRQPYCLRMSEMIFKKLKEFGAELVFFRDGPNKEEKYSAWLKKYNDRYEKNEVIFQSLRDERKIDYYYSGQILTSYYENLCLVARKYGRIFIALENECDMDVAYYATRNNALAVFTGDTDFLIMPGDWQVWLPSKFCFKNFTTVGWNKFTLRQSLNLKQSQMPIFSVLCGNDYVPHSCVQHINKSSRDRDGTHQKNVANLIQKEFQKGVPLSQSDIEKIADLIYVDDEGDYTLREIRVLVKKGIDFYNYSTRKSNPITPKWLKDHIYETSSITVYSLYKGIPYSINHLFIDLSKKDTKSFSDLVIPIVRRQMGIVLSEKKPQEIHRFIYHKPSHEEPFQRRVYTPKYPEFDVPTIDEILKNEKKTELSEPSVEDKLKFDILCWIVSPTKQLNYENCIEIMDTIYFIPSLVLNYLVMESQITIDEADVILLAVGTAFELPMEKADLLQPPEKYTERSFWLAFLFTQLLAPFVSSLVVSGLSRFTKEEFFDGFIFHKMYLTYLSMDNEQKKELIKPYEMYRLYVNN